jgi:hypothetical protein
MITNARLRWVPNADLRFEAALPFSRVTAARERSSKHRYAIALEHAPLTRSHWAPAHRFLTLEWGNRGGGEAANSNRPRVQPSRHGRGNRSKRSGEERRERLGVRIAPPAAAAEEYQHSGNDEGEAKTVGRPKEPRGVRVAGSLVERTVNQRCTASRRSRGDSDSPSRSESGAPQPEGRGFRAQHSLGLSRAEPRLAQSEAGGFGMPTSW